ncbi:MAG: 16S rRNA (uracil(1498)-N(3))-methyltransferase [Alphaproteobacteria bacterium]|nr:16S rRNA (uracil(1498)-N(3))-methyltransferase [Alphaproteobacteria bacterium]
MTERRTPRLYVASGLASGGEAELDRAQTHYLRSVLRLDAGAAIAAFNTADGEWLCHVAEFGKRGARLSVEAQLRAPEPEAEPDLWLMFAPIKRARLDWLVEKATELGVTAFLPVWTARTQVERINLERLRAHTIEAAEQSERVSVPEMRAPEALRRVLASWPAARGLILCDERGAGEPICDAAARLPPGPMALLVGPEGGFDETELDAFGKLSFVTRVGLGPRVLRAETATLAAVAVFQAIAGDWRRGRIR